MAEGASSGGSPGPVTGEVDNPTPASPSAQDSLTPSPQYDPDAFNSMAVVNSELWNEDQPDEGDLSLADIMPQGVAGLGLREAGQVLLRAAQAGAANLVREVHHIHGNRVLHTRDSDQYTALHRAAYNGHLEVAEYLLMAGARMDARTIDGWQPIHCACRWNKTCIASLLLQNGASVNAQTNGGQTPLHLAASNSNARPTLLLLLSHPAVDISLRNGQEDTAFDVAQRCGCHGYLFEMAGEGVDYRRFLPRQERTDEEGQ